jgi:addiction module RelB/DinJ family antitoxin
MPTTVMSLKTDKQLKAKAQKLAKQLGFPLGTLINAFLRQFVRNKSIYFSLEANDWLQQQICEELKQMKKEGAL